MYKNDITFAAGELNKKMVAENNIDYKAMSGSSSQQVLIALDKNLKSYFSAIKSWKRDNKKFTGCPKFPRYKPVSYTHLTLPTT